MTVQLRRRPIFSSTYGLGQLWSPVPNPQTIYENSRQWLFGSNAAAALIDFLERDKIVVHLLISQAESMPNKFWIPDEIAQLQPDPIMPFGREDVLVTWNPTTTWSVHQFKKFRPIGRWSDKNVQKMAQKVRTEIIMIHEFGHVRQWLLKNRWYYAKWQAAVAGNNAANLEIEHDNLRIVESVVARQLGQGVRWHYANNC